jgi:hypothetical protein
MLPGRLDPESMRLAQYAGAVLAALVVIAVFLLHMLIEPSGAALTLAAVTAPVAAFLGWCFGPLAARGGHFVGPVVAGSAALVIVPLVALGGGSAWLDVGYRFLSFPMSLVDVLAGAVWAEGVRASLGGDGHPADFEAGGEDAEIRVDDRLALLRRDFPESRPH